VLHKIDLKLSELIYQKVVMADLLNSSIEQKLKQFNFLFEVADIKTWTPRSKFLPGILYDKREIEVDDFCLFYQECITLAIYSSNWKLVKCFWEDYYYDIGFPNFNDIFTIAEFGDGKTFIIGLQGILVWMDTISHIDVTFEELRNLATRNPHLEVLEIIDRLLLIPNVLTMPDSEATSGSSEDSMFKKQFAEWLVFKEKLIENLMEEFEMLKEYERTKRMEPREEDV
jgi:hypothetical protein